MELDLDPRVARIGMQVLIHAPQTSVVIARAVVEDIAADGGVARITQVLTAQQTIDQNHRVQLQSGPALSTNAAAKADRARADTERAQASLQLEVRQESQAMRQLRGVGPKLLGPVR
jgi:hypothetical protein